MLPQENARPFANCFSEKRFVVRNYKLRQKGGIDGGVGVAERKKDDNRV